MVRPFIRSIAYHCGLKLNHPHTALGEHPLIFKDTEEVYKANTPASVIFNTRSGMIVVGENCVFGEDVNLLTGKHNCISDVADLRNLHEVPKSGRNIIIGKGCYIGSGAIIIGPVSIGDYAVICAGSVVTKDVPSQTMYGGVPAKNIKDLKINQIK